MAFVSTHTLPRSSFPRLNRHILSARGDICAVGRPRCRVDRAGMILVAQEITSCEGIPGVHAAIKAARNKTFAIRRPCNAKNSVLLVVGKHTISGKSCPDLYRAITKVSARGDIETVRGPRKAARKTGMAVIGENAPACICLPYVYDAVSIARGNVFTIRRPG